MSTYIVVVDDGPDVAEMFWQQFRRDCCRLRQEIDRRLERVA